MGRFYKTAASAPIDYMYQANIPLMQQVIAANDQYITQNLGHLGQADTLANSISALDADSDRAKEISEMYSSKINSLADQIRKDPANWRDKIGHIRDLTKDLQTNFKNGEISKISYNYSQYKKLSDDLDKQVEEFNKSGKGVSADRAAAYKRYYLNQFMERGKGTGYDPKTGNYNVFKYDPVMANMDVSKVLGDEMEKIKSDENSEVKEDLIAGGAYFNKTTRKWEGVSPEKILSIAMGRLNNPQLMQYLRSDQKVGLIRGAFDEQGNFIRPFAFQDVPLSEEEQQKAEGIQSGIDKIKDPQAKKAAQDILNANLNKLKARRELEWNPNSFLSPIMQGLVKQHSWAKTSSENDLSNNSLYNTKLVQAHQDARSAADRGSRERIANQREAGVNKRFEQSIQLQKDRLAFDKDKENWDREHPKGTTSKSKTSTTKSTIEEKPRETGIATLSTNSFEDWTTTDYKTNAVVPVLSVAGLSSEIVKKKAEVQNYEGQIKALTNQLLGMKPNSPAELQRFNELKTKKEALTLARKKVEGELSQRREWYNRTSEMALYNKGLSEGERKLYQEFDGDRDGTKFLQHIQDLKKTYPDEVTVDSEYGTQFRTEHPEIVNLRKKHREYLNTKKKVDGYRDSVLKELRTSYIKSDAIIPNDQESKDLRDIILANPTGMVLYNTSGERVNMNLDGQGIKWNDEYTTSMDGAGGFPDYVQRYGTKLQIDRVAASTNLGGGGPVLQVTIKNDPGGNFKDGEVLYIKGNTALQKALVSKFKGHKNPEVAKIAGDIGDEEANAIRTQIYNPNTTGVMGLEDKKTIFVTDRNGNKKPLYVTELDNGKFSIYGINTQSGQPEAFPNTEVPDMPGIFDNIESFIASYKKIKTQ
jgi:hypothetical protein